MKRLNILILSFLLIFTATGVTGAVKLFDLQLDPNFTILATLAGNARMSTILDEELSHEDGDTALENVKTDEETDVVDGTMEEGETSIPSADTEIIEETPANDLTSPSVETTTSSPESEVTQPGSADTTKPTALVQTEVKQVSPDTAKPAKPTQVNETKQSDPVAQPNEVKQPDKVKKSDNATDETSKTEDSKPKGKLALLSEDNVIVEEVPAREKLKEMKGIIPKISFIVKTFGGWLTDLVDNVL